MIDPVNGCERCGLATCPKPAAHVAYFAALTAGAANYRDLSFAMLTADRDCESRPAVDWRAECARLAARVRELETT